MDAELKAALDGIAAKQAEISAGQATINTRLDKIEAAAVKDAEMKAAVDKAMADEEGARTAAAAAAAADAKTKEDLAIAKDEEARGKKQAAAKCSTEPDGDEKAAALKAEAATLEAEAADLRAAGAQLRAAAAGVPTAQVNAMANVVTAAIQASVSRLATDTTATVGRLATDMGADPSNGGRTSSADDPSRRSMSAAALNQLCVKFPQLQGTAVLSEAKVDEIFASTEAGKRMATHERSEIKLALIAAGRMS